METDLIISYLHGELGTGSLEETIDRIFEYNLMVIIPDFYKTMREYGLGLDFAENMIGVIESMRDQKEDHIYRGRLQTMLLMKLDMLDMMNLVKEYLVLFDEMLVADDMRYISAYPDSICNLPPGGDRYIAFCEGEECHLNFLYSIDWRHRVMLRKWKKFITGKPLGNQLRHQRDELTDDQIIHRADAFFERYKNTYLAGVMK